MHEQIEQKWRKKWDSEHIYNAEITKKEKKYVTAAFPYPNSPQHIGHGRTYTTADIYARFLRMKGYNVLFPMAFHVTGTPIIAMAKRIADKDQEVLRVFDEIYGIPPAKAATLTKPEDLVMYFSKEIEEGMKEMGYSIDWRRKFYSFDKKFNRFIQWQFHKLKELGYLVQGEYPIAWCPSDNQAVGGHDTKGDVDPELKDFMWIKFHLKESDLILMTGTTRPDALLGQTNLWIDPHGKYKIVQVKKEKWIVGEVAINKIYEQCDPDAKIIGEISAKELIGKWAKGPIVNYELYTLPAEFIDAKVGSGLVYSALEDPVDLYELRKIQSAPSTIKHYNLDQKVVAELKPIPIIDVEGMGKDLGDSIGKEFGITSADQKDKLEEAKGELNRRVYRKGIMNNSCGKYSGMSVPKCQDAIKKDLMDSYDAVMFMEINNNPVYCRCGTEVVVKLLKDQWFIDYGNEKWKKLAKKCLEKMNIVPEKTRNEYLYAIDWFKQKPCSRNRGLGTRFPFDEKLVIEALSDSTIYMAFYTFAHLLEDIGEKEMNNEFFDYVVLGKEPKDKKLRAKSQKLRASLLYWYPCDSRHSAGDLIRNHLPFYIFNHVGIFPEEHWPKQIVTNGFVLMDGKKMSKSMGNILPLRKAIKEYGADVIRFSIVSGADLTQDTDFNKSVAEGTKTRLAFFSQLIKESAKKEEKLQHMDKWILSRLNRKIKRAKEFYERLSLRELALEVFYELYHDLSWYLKRVKKPNLFEFFKKWVLLVSPFMPYYTEEYWGTLGQKGFACFQKFPEAEDDKIDDRIEQSEEIVKQVREDIEKIKELAIKEATQKISSIQIYVASDWKRDLQEIMIKEKKFDSIMKAAKEKKMDLKRVQEVVKQTIKNVYSLQPPPEQKVEMNALEDAKEFFEKEFSCSVGILSEDKAEQDPKAKNARPGKPAIKLNVG